MATLTTSFNIVVKTYEQKWDDVISNIRSGGGIDVGTVFPMKLTDGTDIKMVAVDVDTNGDVAFGGAMSEEMAFDSNNNPVTFHNSTLGNYLNGTFYSMIPQNIKNAIKAKQTKYLKWDFKTLESSVQDNIWIPTRENVFGAVNETWGSIPRNDDKQLSFYDGTRTIINKVWWLATPNNTAGTGKYNEYVMGIQGNTSSYALINAKRTVCPHFIIGAQ